MKGGAITNNSAANYNGGGIYNAGTLNLQGGEITGNSSGVQGGGILNNGTMNISGAPVVKDNTADAENGSPNIYLRNDHPTMTVTGKLTDGAELYVTSAKGTAPITTGYGSKHGTEYPGAYFHADNTEYVISLADGEVNIASPFKVSVKTGDEGSLSVDKTAAGQGETVTVTVLDDTPLNMIAVSYLANLIVKSVDFIPGDNRTGTFVMPGADVTVSLSYAPVSTKYIDTNGDEKTVTAYPLQGSTAELTGNGNFYVVNRNLTLTERLEINVPNGMVSLILADGCTLTAAKGIELSENNSLVIYCQSEGTGKLAANGEKYYAGIGIRGGVAGIFTIYGGTVEAAGGTYAAGIGGGERAGGGGTVNIHGGTVTATGDHGAAGIGGGTSGNGGTTTISGGIVTATGGLHGATGIGGGSGGYGGTTAISGGTVTATGGNWGAGIGGGRTRAGGTITISGGTVTAKAKSGGEGNGAGIGTGYDASSGETNITISGGKVTANSSKGAAGIGQGTNATASVTTTLTYTDDTKQDIEITASSYSGTVTFDKKFRSLDGTLRVHGIFQDLGVLSGQTMVAEDGTYRVVIAAAEHGAVTADQERYHVNDEVRLEIVPDTDYILSSLNVDEQDVTGEVDSEGVYTFVMPEYDVTVTATFTQAFCTVTFDTDGGSLVAAQTVNYGEKAVKPDDPTREGYTFGGWQLDGADYDFDTPVTADITLVAVWEEMPTVIIKGISGSFNDRIKLNYYFDIPAEVLADEGLYVALTKEGAETVITVPIGKAEYFEGKGWKFSIPLAAKEASDTVTARMFDGNGDPLRIVGSSGTDYTETGVPYTLMDYFTWLESNGTTDEKKVGAAAKDYCAAAQIYFGYNADGLSVSGALDAVTADTLSVYAAGRTGKLPAGVSIRGITAMLESDNTLRIYFSLKNVDAESFAFKIDGKGAALKQRSDGMYFLAMDAGVLSNRLQDVHSYSVSDGANTYTVTASVLTFARSYVVNGNEKESNLGKALYLYNKAAVEAFGN